MDHFDDEASCHFNYWIRKRRHRPIAYQCSVWRTGVFDWVVNLEEAPDGSIVMTVWNEDERLVYADLFVYDESFSVFVALLRGSFMSFLSKIDSSVRLKSVMEVSADESISKKWPALYEYLTATHYEDGTDRQTATLSISVADDGWKFCLRDRDGGRCLWITSLSFMDAFKSLDAALRVPDAAWVRDRFSTNGKASNKDRRK